MTSEGPRSLEHGISILEAFTLGAPELGVSEISRTLGLTKSTVHRLVTALVKRGYLLQDDDTRKYRLSFRMYEIGCVAVQRLGLHKVAYAVLEELGMQTGETVHISVLSDGAVTYLHSLESTQPVRTHSRLGQRSPVTCTANGKVFLAHSPDTVRQSFLSGGLPRFTPNTITNMDAFERELADIRLQGYALDREELQEGIRCIAAPIRDHTERVIAALGLSAPAIRMDGDRVAGLAPLLVEAASRVSCGLGYRPEPGVDLRRDAMHHGVDHAGQAVR
ncbi:MAG: IclR family transcriptional regulator [Chloroflexota bacterium]